MTRYEGQNRLLAEHLFRPSEDDGPVDVGRVYMLDGCDGQYPVLLMVTRTDTGVEGIVNVVPFHWHPAAVAVSDLFVPSRLAGADLVVMLDESFSIPEARLEVPQGRMPLPAMNLILDTMSFRVTWTPTDEESSRIEDAVFQAVYSFQREVADVVYKGFSLTDGEGQQE